jgi:hypothetical protein
MNCKRCGKEAVLRHYPCIFLKVPRKDMGNSIGIVDVEPEIEASASQLLVRSVIPRGNWLGQQLVIILK